MLLYYTFSACFTVSFIFLIIQYDCNNYCTTRQYSMDVCPSDLRALIGLMMMMMMMMIIR